MSEDMRINDLVSSVQRIRSIINRIEDRVDSAESTDLGVVHSAYVTQLAQKWNDYSTVPNHLPTLEALHERVKMLAEFVERFNDLAQQPRRSAIAQSLNTWLHKWTISNIKWQDYLYDAVDEQLEAIETQINTLEQPDLGDERIKHMVQRWFEYQAKRLRSTEKSTQHVVELLIHVNRNLLDARRLVDELLVHVTAAIPEKVEQPVVAQIRMQWGEQLRDKITSSPIEIESLGLDDLLIGYEGNWQTFQSGLTNLGAVLASCNEAEVTFVQREVNSLPTIDHNLIDDLVETIAEIRSVQEWNADSVSLLDYDPEKNLAVPQDVQNLIDKRPVMPTSERYQSFREFRAAMHEYKKVADIWLKECKALYGSIQRETENWRDSNFPEDILREITNIENEQDELASLAQLIATSFRLHTVKRQANLFVKESLEPEEQQVWQHFQDLKLEGKEMVYLDEVPGDEREPITKAVAKLAQKGLIKVRIEL